jgi:HlyD family secretion protein
LTYCTIVSPVKGVIIDRRVNIGQTVVSSLSAPSLFLIAKDLKRMQVWASVNEADVGSIYAGQSVTFTVDAFPGHPFIGTVGKVRYNATMTQNVVTYTVEINTDNSNNKLIPYLTANVQFEIAKRQNALLVPTAALRWTPQESQVAPDVRAQNAQDESNPDRHVSNADGSPMARSNGDDGATPAAAPATTSTTDEAANHPQKVHYDRGMVWIQDGNYVRPIPVRAGVSDGANTEVVFKNPGDLPEGTRVIVGDTIADAGGAGTTNPFMPQFGRRPGQR